MLAELYLVDGGALVNELPSGPSEAGGLKAAARGVGYFDAMSEFEYLTSGTVVYGKRSLDELLEELGVSPAAKGSSIASELVAEYVVGYRNYVDEMMDKLRGQLAEMRRHSVSAPDAAKAAEDLANAESSVRRLEDRLDNFAPWPGGVLFIGGGIRRP